MVTWTDALSAIASTIGAAAGIFIGIYLYKEEKKDSDKSSLYQLKVLLADKVIIPWKTQYSQLLSYHNGNDTIMVNQIIICLNKLEQTMFIPPPFLEEKLFMTVSNINEKNTRQYLSIVNFFQILPNFHNRINKHYDDLCEGCLGSKSCPNNKLMPNANKNALPNCCDKKITSDMMSRINTDTERFNAILDKLKETLGSDNIDEIVKEIKSNI